jgi:molecular chaperone DnaJ
VSSIPAAQRDYYEVLGVPRDADAPAIKDAFRKLALRYHPDRNKEPGAEDRFKEIAEAYAVLSDPKKRAAYDAGGFARVSGLTPEDLFANIDFEDLLGGLSFDWGGGLFDRFFGRRRRAGPARGADVEVMLEIPLERVLTGGEETVTVGRAELCAACAGSAAEPGTSPRACGACEGTGRHVASTRERGVTFQHITTCTSCGGQGRIIDTPCRSCGGRGEVQRADTLSVTVPPGVEDGTVLRIPRRGLPSRDTSGSAGDLLVVVRTAADPRFERAGADLARADAVNVADAVLGTTLDVPTLEGMTTVSVPPGTQPGAVLRLRGKGLPVFGGRRRGDLYLRLHITVPESLTAEERQLWERLRALRRKPRARPHARAAVGGQGNGR